MLQLISSNRCQKLHAHAHLERSEMITTAEAAEAATERRSEGTSGFPCLNTKVEPKRSSSGMMRRKVASIASFGWRVSTAMTLPPSFLYAWHSCRPQHAQHACQECTKRVYKFRGLCNVRMVTWG